MKIKWYSFLLVFFCLHAFVNTKVQAQEYQIQDSFIRIVPLARSFSKIIVSDGITLVYNQSNEDGLGVSASTEAYFQNIDVVLAGDTLKLGLKKFLTDNKFKPDYKVYASSISCSFIYLANAARVIILGELKADSFSIVASNAAKIDAELSVKSLSLDLSSASLAQLEGKVGEASILVKDASKLNAKKLQIDSASLTAKGASKIYTLVNSSCEILAEGASKIYLQSKPKSFTKITRGLSKVIIDN